MYMERCLETEIIYVNHRQSQRTVVHGDLVLYLFGDALRANAGYPPLRLQKFVQPAFIGSPAAVGELLRSSPIVAILIENGRTETGGGVKDGDLVISGGADAAKSHRSGANAQVKVAVVVHEHQLAAVGEISRQRAIPFAGGEGAINDRSVSQRRLEHGR